MRITIQQDKCIGAGLCVLGAEDVFDQREEDGIVVLLDPNPPAEREAAIREAAATCPVLAIEVEADNR
ncbi:ferredoxin [Nocardia vinacea]|uniref:Ferredoxin n=1 Tax=Nocardia vinacea TaxID=96468 RepID=A0ABZ1YXP0_9NOCA|nr:ferredoxin [Nocardia vinacea]